MVDLSAAYQEVKTLPDEALARELSNPSGMVPGYLVMAEMEDRKAIRSNGGGGNAPKSSMKDELLQGIGSVQRFAIGGLVRRANNPVPEEDPLLPPQGLDGGDPKYVWSNSMALSEPGWVLPSVAPGLNMYGRNFEGMLSPVSTDQTTMPGAKPPVTTPQQAGPQKKKFAAGGLVSLMNPGYGQIMRAQNPLAAQQQEELARRAQESGPFGLASPAGLATYENAASLSSMVPTASGVPAQPKPLPSSTQIIRRP